MPTPETASAPDPETSASQPEQLESPSPEEKEADDRIPKSIVDFMAAYDLSDFEEDFYEAIKKRRFSDLAQNILDQTGLSLIILDTVPDHIKKKYGVFSYPLDPMGHETHFLFWKPELAVSRFHYRYKGEEIRTLQKLLADLGLYDGSLDGVVGEKLIKAVKDYQVRAGLRLTGYPDQATIFLLCHEEADKS